MYVYMLEKIDWISQNYYSWVIECVGTLISQGESLPCHHSQMELTLEDINCDFLHRLSDTEILLRDILKTLLWARFIPPEVIKPLF